MISSLYPSVRRGVIVRPQSWCIHQRPRTLRRSIPPPGRRCCFSQRRTSVDPRRPNPEIPPIPKEDHRFRSASWWDLLLQEEAELDAARDSEATDTRLRVQICWSTDDVTKDRPPRDRDMATDERFEHLRGNTVRDVRAKAQEMYGTAQDLEYYNGRDWMPLETDEQLRPYHQGKVLPIRIPEYFEEWQLLESEDEAAWDDQDEQVYHQYKEFVRHRQDALPQQHPVPPPSMTATTATPQKWRTNAMERAIRELAQRLQSQGYQRSPISKRTMLDRHQQPIVTSTWVLHAAKEDATLRALLLAHPGALSHVVTGLHLYESLWRARATPPGGKRST